MESRGETATSKRRFSEASGIFNSYGSIYAEGIDHITYRLLQAFNPMLKIKRDLIRIS